MTGYQGPHTRKRKKWWKKIVFDDGNCVQLINMSYMFSHSQMVPEKICLKIFQ